MLQSHNFLQPIMTNGSTQVHHIQENYISDFAMHGSDIGLTKIHACSYRNVNSKCNNNEKQKTSGDYRNDLAFKLAPDSLRVSFNAIK